MYLYILVYYMYFFTVYLVYHMYFTVGMGGAVRMSNNVID